MNFVAIAVEAANRDIGSICQIGLAKYVDGELMDSYGTLINPQSCCSERNLEIYSITNDMVLDAPLIMDVYNEILTFIHDNIVVSHTYFD